MTERERLLAVLRGRTPDRTPWYADLSWWYSAHQARGDLPREWADAGDGYLQMHRDLGAGIYLYAPMVWTEEVGATVQAEVRTEGPYTTSTLTAPAGQVRSVTQELPESGTSAYVEHYVKTPADLRVMEYAFTHRTVRPNYAEFERCDAAWGDDGMACVLSPVCTSALQTLLSRWAGVETTIALLADARDDLERTLDAIQRSDDAIFDLICAGPGEYVEFPENLSGEVTGRRLIQRYELPYWRRRIAQLHAAGKRVGIHNDGTLRASLPLLVEAGFDVVESVTPWPVGDMTLDGIRAVTEGRCIVWGCLPGAMFSPLTPDAEFRAFVREVLRTFPPGSGFVLGAADQVPPDASAERIRLVRDLVDAQG